MDMSNLERSYYDETALQKIKYENDKNDVKNIIYSIYHNQAQTYTITELSGGCSGSADHEHSQHHSKN